MPNRYMRRQRRLSDPEICALYESGMDSESVGVKAGMSGATVLGICRRHGVAIRARGTRKGARLICLTLDDATICRRYKNGECARQIAESCEATENQIYSVLERCDVPRRSNRDILLARRRMARARRHDHTDP
jgi:hypothetical protein